MRPSVTLETLRGQRRSLLVWSVALAGLIAMYVAVYPSVEGSGSSFSKLIEQMPDAYKALFTTGGGIDFSTPAGYLNVELFTFMGPIVVLLYAISSGASAIAGEEDRHTMELLLVNAVGRRRVLLEKFAALAAGVTCLVSALWLALLLEGRLAGMDVPVADSAAALAHLGLLGIEFGSVALLVGARSPVRSASAGASRPASPSSPTSSTRWRHWSAGSSPSARRPRSSSTSVTTRCEPVSPSPPSPWPRRPRPCWCRWQPSGSNDVTSAEPATRPAVGVTASVGRLLATVSSGARRRGARRRAARLAPPGTPWRPAPGPPRSRR